MTEDGAELSFYYRQGCHLCDDMWQQLQALGVTPRAVDITGDPALEARFGRLIPVLMRGDRELCHYYLDPRSLQP